MSAAPMLFDHALFATRMRRAAAMSAAGADFLLRRAADDLGERLQTVLRPFPKIADVGTTGPQFREVLQRLRPESRLSAATPAESTPEVLDSTLKDQDLIVSGLALQHANDLPGALIQIRRALVPDGLFMGCLLGGATLTELRQALTEAESDTTGGVSPRVFPFADVRDMGGLLQRAGFALPVADSEAVTVRYADMFRLIADLRAMGGTNVLLARSRRFTRRATFLKAAEIYARRFGDSDGRIRATFEIVWLSGWAPHESQQKP
ncbi:MAG: SAM-dependent methyltransferase, partial [Beijerinckiaceae bacterium]